MTEITLAGEDILLDGTPTYPGREWQGHRIEGLLLNSRMVQAVFDDAAEETRPLWVYPDTGTWDPERNTDEFVAALPTYRAHGLLGVTVGLQGGGSNYRSEVIQRYRNSAFHPDGSLDPAYTARLARILEAADRLGMVVIVNLFYWRHAAPLVAAGTVHEAIAQACGWLLESGHRNVVVDVANEANAFWKLDPFLPEQVHQLIRTAQSCTHQGRRLLVGCSTAGGGQLPTPEWLAAEDISFPHGNGLDAAGLAAKVQRLREQPAFRARPRPICINEDGIDLANLDAAVAGHASWGLYHQGYGCDYRDRTDWTIHGREERYEDLSGFQTLPVNWGLNTPLKRTIFEHIAEIAGVDPGMP